jgi:hypothetical protein
MPPCADDAPSDSQIKPPITSWSALVSDSSPFDSTTGHSRVRLCIITLLLLPFYPPKGTAAHRGVMETLDIYLISFNV